MNRLADEASLYLRQHAENPVDWYPWGDEAFARARDLKRPVLLSIGYSACHWCHVMAHESFEDETTAALMNELFVCVKVDREERPDVDALYMQATLALSGSGGWPMTVFLTPDARPFFAGTYFPPTARQGMPSFSDLCRSIAEAYESRPEDVESQAAEVTSRLTHAAAPTGSGRAFTPSLVDDALVGLARTFDPRMGGFGGAPKFPPSLALEFLVRRAQRRPDDVNAREMAELTLRRMADGGICDQIGGGFHRYSVDAVWLVPHFEKMLYDNALLARAYTLAFELTGDAQMQRVAESTLDYLLREMRVEGGAFAAAQDADSEGGEGAFFVWTPEQLDQLLTPDEVRAATLHYGVTEQGNFEGATIPYLALPLDAVAKQIGGDPVALIESARAKLYAARSARPAPARDDKVITAWNGLAIAAFADAGRILGRDDYLTAARSAARFLLTQMITDGRLRRTGRHLGQLDDHADLCHGLLQLYDATFEPEWLAASRNIAAKMIELFADPEGSGFLYAGNDSEVLLAPTRDLEDHPTPAGNSQAAWVLLRLASLTGDTDFEARAIAALDLVGGDLVRFPHAFGTALVAIDHVAHDRREVAVVGPRDDPRTIALLDTARCDGGPGTALAWGDPADPTFADQVPLLADRALVAGEPSAYVCRQFSCQAPVTTPEALRAFLT